MTVADRIQERGADLTETERRVAEVVLARPELVAFGTVAVVANEAETSGATVVRTGKKLGYGGFIGLRVEVQNEVLAERERALRPAAERIRRRVASDLIAQSLDAELRNIRSSLGASDPVAFEAAVGRLATAAKGVAVLSGDATHGVAQLLADGLGMLRPGVRLVTGSETRVARTLAHLTRGDVVVVLDLRRYERWVLAAAEAAAGRGAHLIALTDSPLSPLARLAGQTFVVSAEGVGPFDSHVGTLALGNALVAGVAAKLRRSATRRLDRVEKAWRDAGALVEP